MPERDMSNCPDRLICSPINCPCPYPPVEPEDDTEAIYRQADESCGFHRYATRPASSEQPTADGPSAPAPQTGEASDRG